MRESCFLVLLLLFSCGPSANQQASEAPVVASELELEEKVESSKEIIPIVEYPIAYLPVEEKAISGTYTYENIELEEAIELADIALLTGKLTNSNDGLRLTVLNNEKQPIFQSSGLQDSWRLKLACFKSKVQEKLIIIGETGAEESWGVYVYLYEKGTFSEMGFLDVIALNEYEESQNILPFLIIEEYQEGEIRIGFKTGTKLAELETEKTFFANEGEYIYDQGKFIRQIPAVASH